MSKKHNRRSAARNILRLAAKPELRKAEKPVATATLPAETPVAAKPVKPVSAPAKKPVATKPVPPARKTVAKPVAVARDKRNTAKPVAAKPVPSRGQINAWRAWVTMHNRDLKTAETREQRRAIRAKIAELETRLAPYPRERDTTVARSAPTVNGRKSPGQLSAYRAWVTMRRRRLADKTLPAQTRAKYRADIANYTAILAKNGIAV